MADRLWHSLPEERLISVSFAFRKASEALARCQAKSSTSVRQYFHACSWTVQVTGVSHPSKYRDPDILAAIQHNDDELQKQADFLVAELQKASLSSVTGFDVVMLHRLVVIARIQKALFRDAQRVAKVHVPIHAFLSEKRVLNRSANLLYRNVQSLKPLRQVYRAVCRYYYVFLCECFLHSYKHQI